MPAPRKGKNKGKGGVTYIGIPNELVQEIKELKKKGKDRCPAYALGTVRQFIIMAIKCHLIELNDVI